MWWKGDEVTFKRLWQGRPSDPLAWWVHDMIKCHFRKAQSRISASWSTSFPFIGLHFCRLHFRFFFFFISFFQDSQFKVQRRREEINLSSGHCLAERLSFRLLAGKLNCQQLYLRSYQFFSANPTNRKDKQGHERCWGFKSILQSLRRSSLQK